MATFVLLNLERLLGVDVPQQTAACTTTVALPDPEAFRLGTDAINPLTASNVRGVDHASSLKALIPRRASLVEPVSYLDISPGSIRTAAIAPRSLQVGMSQTS